MPKITIDTINNQVKDISENYVCICEDSFTKSLENVANKILLNKGRCLVMLAGPSSSGKTTTAKILAKILNSKNRNAFIVSLDDFYKEQSNSPVFEDGTPDFETIDALDVDNIINSLHTLCLTGECYLPIFDFIEKKPRPKAKYLKIDNDDIIIVEGLHALNPKIIEPLKNETMLKLYVSVSTRIYDNDGKVVFSKRDIRFIRRLIRDYNFRSTDVNYTFFLWHGVRRGEDAYLFPFTKNADIKIDSIHPYELCLYKNNAIRLLESVSPESRYYDTARSYIDKLQLLISMNNKSIPENSLLHEFIG